MEPGLSSWKFKSNTILVKAANDSLIIQFWLPVFLFLTQWLHCFGDIMFTVQEELPNGVLVGNLNEDLGLGNGKYTSRELSMDFADGKQYLFINPEDGNVFINERIDREIICGTTSPCHINLRVVMKHPFQLFSAKMDILDINDNAPTFPVNNLHISIKEYVPVGTRFAIQSASDEDVGSNGITNYKLSVNDHFSLDIGSSTDGGLTAHLVLDKSLDREHKSLHELLVIAIDGGEPQRTGTLQIVINVLDANDNSPVFEKPVYKVSLAEDTPAGTLVIQVKATDRDEGTNGELVYSFSRHTPKKLRDKFDINSYSGEIRLKNITGMDETKSYELHVQAADKGPSALSGYCKVLLDITDVNNNLPEIAVTLVSDQIMEDAEVGTVVALVTITDRDFGINAVVSCHITDNIPFKLRSVAEYYTLITDGPLDRETVGSYNITITAIDSGSPPLSSETNIIVHIADVNDNPPRFSQELYKVYINENNSVGDFICQVSALDPDLDRNSRLTYTLLETDRDSLPVMKYVSISNENGNVYARSIFDFEKERKFEVLIQAKDQGNPPLSSTATVQVSIVDQNDNPPMFLYPPTTDGYVAVEMVPRSAEVGFLVTKVITVDADSGQNAWLSYQLLQASDTSLVNVDGQTGEIKILRNIRVTDSNKHRLIIEVKDNGIPKRSASVTIGLWLYDTFPQVLPDFEDVEISDNPISNLNIYLIITVVSIAFLFFGFLIILISVLCYRQEYVTSCPCLSICCDFEIASHKMKTPGPLISALPTDLLDVAGSETLSHNYQYKAFLGFVPQTGTALPVNSSMMDSENNITSEGLCVQFADMEGNVTQGDAVQVLSDDRGGPWELQLEKAELIRQLMLHSYAWPGLIDLCSINSILNLKALVPTSPPSPNLFRSNTPTEQANIVSFFNTLTQRLDNIVNRLDAIENNSKSIPTTLSALQLSGSSNYPVSREENQLRNGNDVSNCMNSIPPGQISRSGNAQELGTTNPDDLPSKTNGDIVSTNSIPPGQIQRSGNQHDLGVNITNSTTSNNTGFVNVSNFTEWVNNFDNLTSGFQLNQEQLIGDTPLESVSRPTISEKLKTLDFKLVKIKKLQLEVVYFKQCLKERLVPKGLRNYQFPTGLVPDSMFHKELMNLFDNSGFTLMELMIKHYTVQIDELLVEVNSLDIDVKADINFTRYKYDYDRVFSSIDQMIEKLKVNKIRKLNRDRLAYSNGSAYPRPKTSQVWNNETLTSNNTEANRFNNNSHDCNLGDDSDLCPPTEPVRRSERLQANNRENSKGQHQQQAERPTDRVGNEQGFHLDGQTMNKSNFKTPRNQRNKGNNNTHNTMLKIASVFNPPLHPLLKNFENMCELDIRHIPFLRNEIKSTNNTSHEQLQALEFLRSQSIRCIKPDKGGGLVIMDYSDYNNRMETVLDSAAYEIASINEYNIALSRVKSYFRDLFIEGRINIDTFNYINITFPRLPIMFGIPKIHKNLSNPPMRPLIDGRGSLTYPCAKVVDLILQKFLKSIPRVCKDSWSLLTDLNEVILEPSDNFLTIDVVDLYTSIPHLEVVEWTSLILKEMEALENEIDLCPVSVPKMIMTTPVHGIQWQVAIFVVVCCWPCGFGDTILIVPEELPRGALVGNIAKDFGIGTENLPARELRIVFGDSKQYLTANSDDGNLFINENIDREIICANQMPCHVNFQGLMEHPFEIFNVVMEILDINDNAPTFPVTDLHFNVAESVQTGTKFPIRRAQDSDVGSNALSKYWISTNNHFTLDVKNSSDGGLIVQLVLDKSLDREEKTVHYLSLIAADGGEPRRSGSVQIIVNVLDANDNSPVFDQAVYKTSLPENSPVGALVIQVNANDLDEGTNADIVYSFSSHTANEMLAVFDINPSTGEVRLKRTIDLHIDTDYDLEVQATDKGFPALTEYCKVLVDIIDINNNAPEIVVTRVSSHLREDSSVGTVIALVSVTDRDSGVNALVRCRITEGIPFKLKSSNRYYTLVTDGPLDREDVSAYNITICATDSGNPPLSAEMHIFVQIIDVNDNPPRFPKDTLKVYVKENNSVGDFLCQIIAMDPDLDENGRVTYSVLDNKLDSLHAMNYVSVSTESGNVYAKSVFDYEKLKTFEILVEAVDKGSPSLSSNVTVQVTIVDQNDNDPVFLYPSTANGDVPVEMVPRSAEAGFLVTKVITVDADSGQNAWLSYQILQSSDPSLFNIDQQTGEIKILRIIKAMDPSKQKIVIEVKDNGIPRRSASVTIGLLLYDSFPQILPDFGEEVESGVHISSLNRYLLISVVSISFLFFGFLITLSSLACRRQLNTGSRTCFTICCESEYDRYILKIPVPPNSTLPADIQDKRYSETLSHNYHYNAFAWNSSQNANVSSETSDVGDNGKQDFSQGYCLLIPNVEGQVSKQVNMVCK
ncbi:uncharacterized protein LOC122800403 [Protopterus annectens]|uniref:uncharacterized protein LOC122800403 n=1 Tax=Protopterus annectens TaxID=7888 RepID=UPI001CFA2250|nr:uncharacterized protein LOC122800403 [Protopterus annectens]